MSYFCKDIVALAQGDQTTRLEMAYSFNPSSTLLSLRRVAVPHIAACVSQRRQMKGETISVHTLRIGGTKLGVDLGLGLPRSTRSDGLGRVQLLQSFRVRLLASSLQTGKQYSLKPEAISDQAVWTTCANATTTL